MLTSITGRAIGKALLITILIGNVQLRDYSLNPDASTINGGARGTDG